jgi:dTDP-4-dehydro-6-deoxy-alpha-D-glucopyranose 2,3-dehydratase
MTDTDTLGLLLESWGTRTDTIHSTEAILEWVREQNAAIRVDIRRSALGPDGPWFYDRPSGEIRNGDRSFFQITGLQRMREGRVLHEQPVIVQPEIGYLGIICKEIEGILYLLMQAKIEPGNVNKVQLSPTIQATRSNFLQKHGGRRPAYLDYFLDAARHEIVVDQLQSEQSSRFYRKRNRNILIRVREDIELLPSHRWMTLGQIKGLLRVDNLVNMDTRTVLSCIPFFRATPAPGARERLFDDDSLYISIFNDEPPPRVTVDHCLNNYKMFDDTEIRLVPLHALESWEWRGPELVRTAGGAGFKVIFCDIEIEGREVQRWSQPLFEAVGTGTFVLVTSRQDGVRRFLVRLTPEVGCFDGVELGPTVQMEPVAGASAAGGDGDALRDFVLAELDRAGGGGLESGILHNVLLSEEGGRFYHEQNRNVILEIDPARVPDLPEGCFWLDYRTLSMLAQSNNVLNIQLRNLLSLVDL